ncbi:Uridine kinase [Anaerovibrio lipolyticus DSM 3074]|uniref:Uridine kinase n=1 Tax=Anaerovibrio lipolyticus DSM 3074 TaxID=1120997 RepID=A0A1M6AZC6_9FIRM|nr:nucleoside kinase [Anaerovibrio lipolyticus]SHI41816.1 Uridine kinase [Anaerovibrio lipolyticus DSM 3074]
MFKEVLEEAKEWAKILHCSYVSDLNAIIENGGISDLIRVSEALHEKKIANIADRITGDLKNNRLILIAGPSSSGKTSFAQRLRVQLRVMGLEPVSLSIDNYFVNREDTPKLPDGSYDFESIDAVDIKLFNKQLTSLMDGEKVIIPTFNFKKGIREMNPDNVRQIALNQPIIIEGIHGLNEKLTSAIPRDHKFKIYVSALNQLNMDENTRISTSRVRLLRRIVRDFRTRGRTADSTISLWAGVRAGEEKYIFPYQDDADVMFNSALIYELGALRHHVMYMLSEISPEEKSYEKGQELLAFCRNFKSIYDQRDIPCNSLIREFIGGSCFDVS